MMHSFDIHVYTDRSGNVCASVTMPDGKRLGGVRIDAGDFSSIMSLLCDVFGEEQERSGVPFNTLYNSVWVKT